MNNNYGAIYQPYSSQYRPDTAILSQVEKDRLIEEEVAKRKAAELERKSGFLPKTAEQLGSPYRAGQTISASGQQVGGIIGDVGKASYDGVVGGYKGLYDLAAPVVEGAGNLGRGVLGMRENTEEGFRYANQPQQSQTQPQGASEADLSALAKYRPNGILANAQDIDMGGKGVLRPDEPSTHTMPDGTVMGGATHEEYEQANPPTNPVLNPVETSNEPTSLMADNTIDQQGIKKDSPLLGIAQAASIDRSGTATGNKRDSTKMGIPRIGMAERLMRIGGAVTGASTQGLSASMAAGAQAYGGLQDEERRLAQVEQQNQMSMLSKLRGMNKPTAQQEKQSAADRELFTNTTAMSTRQSFLAKRLAQEGDNVTGMFDGTAKSVYDNMVGNPRSELRLQLEAEAVNAALVSVAQTKGAISNREMELFLSPIPRVGKNQESTWIAWLEMQSALNAIKARRLDPSNLNPDGSLKSRIQADAEASAELEQLYQNLLDTGYKRGGGQSEPNEADSVADKYL